MPYSILVSAMILIVSTIICLIIALVVDKALEVTEQYHVDITQYEHDILLRPKMKTVRLRTSRFFKSLVVDHFFFKKKFISSYHLWRPDIPQANPGADQNNDLRPA